MYPRNAASPERIAVGQVVLISDGTIQTSSVVITVRGQGGAEATGGGTTAYGAEGTVYYTPTQAETNYTSFVVIASKASCFSASQTVVTTASATPGKVVLSGETHASAVIPTVSTVTDGATEAKQDIIDANIDTLLTRIVGTLAAGTHNPASAAQIAVLSDWIDGGRLDLLLDAIKAVTDAQAATGTGLTAIPWNAAWDAEVQSEVNDALVANGLDHLVAASVTGTDVVDNSIVAKLVSSSATADWDDFVNTTDSMQAIRDRGDTAWPTATGFATEAKQDATDIVIAELTTQGDTNETKIDALTANLSAVGVKKNAAFSNYEFLMVLTSDHVTPATGLTVTGQRPIDGGAFASVGGAIAEVSNGIYQFDAMAADTNGDVITWRFSSATADDCFVTFKTVA